MNVHELIQELKNHPGSMLVMVDGYEGGYDELRPTCVAEKQVALNVHDGTDEWY